MNNKQKALVAVAALCLAEAFLDRAVSKTAKAAGLSSMQLAIVSAAAAAVVAKLD